jgi:hypothetical protein
MILTTAIGFLSAVAFGVAIYALVREKDRPITPIAVLLISIVLILAFVAK